VIFEELKQAFDLSQRFPPVVLFQDSEDTSQDVSAVGASAGVAGETAVLDDHQD
jgi:hypothetical protein